MRLKISKHIDISLTTIAILWFIHIANMFVPFDFRLLGIRPHDTGWPWGILFSPFLHANYYHLCANSGALFVLLILSLMFSHKLTAKAVMIIILFGGSCVWMFGDDRTIHIGASGVIFGLIGYLIFLGIFRREWKAFFISLIVLFFYGGALYMLMIKVPGISWAGHFFGFLSGIMAAWFLRAHRVR